MNARMESVGARFRRDVILNDVIKNAQSSVKTIKNALKGLGNSKQDNNIRAALSNLINSVQQRIKEAEKEQNDITRKYGR
ncbi:hypothetical protein AB832_00640 [Flavobacteriaceae bacterium (ex Bugula neritina AB1)]|nr:hypothetical protein AB832_00640 [Flavobacteriaceae bacterium (ex Bugula neritina AB1)]